MNTKLLAQATLGTAAIAVCCFTPVLTAGFAAVGLAAWLGWVDYVLLPLLGAGIAVMLYALVAKPGAAR